jgi:hypothetical protein
MASSSDISGVVLSRLWHHLWRLLSRLWRHPCPYLVSPGSSLASSLVIPGIFVDCLYRHLRKSPASSSDISCVVLSRIWHHLWRLFGRLCRHPCPYLVSPKSFLASSLVIPGIFVVCLYRHLQTSPALNLAVSGIILSHLWRLLGRPCVVSDRLRHPQPSLTSSLAHLRLS